MEDCKDHKNDCYHTNKGLFMRRLNRREKKKRKKMMMTTTPPPTVVTQPSEPTGVQMPTVNLQIAWDVHSQGNIAIKKLCLSVLEETRKKVLTARKRNSYELSCLTLLNISYHLERQKQTVSYNPNLTVSADNFQSIHYYVEEMEKELSKRHGIQLTQT